MGAGEIYKRLTIILSVNDAATAQLSTVSSSLRSFAGVTTQATGQLAKLSHRFMQVGRALVSFLIIRTIGVQFGRFIALMFEGNQVLEKATTSLERLGGSLGYAQKQIEFIRRTAMRAPFDFQSILQASRLLVAYGKDLETYLPILLDWAAALGATSGMLEGYAAAMGKIMAGSPYVLRILTTRAVGLDQWKAALEATNRALPKSERFTQALTIALSRFEGQAAVLAKTMAGLRTNIRDVWVEITREIGLAMFTRIRAVLFDVYEGMRDIADNQRERLYEIGDVFGMWAARLMVIIQRSSQIPQHFKKITVVAKNLAVFVIGRMMVMALVRVGFQIKFAVLGFLALGAVGKAVALTMNALSLVVGLIAVNFVKAKLAAMDFRIYLGDIAAGFEVLRDFYESDEQIFTREQLAAIRTTRAGLVGLAEGLSRIGDELRAVQAGARGLSLKEAFSIEGQAKWWRSLLARVGQGTHEEMISALRRFVSDAGPIIAEVFDNPEWERDAAGWINIIARMAEPGKFDQDVFSNAITNLRAALEGAIPLLDDAIMLSKAHAAVADALSVNYKTQEVALQAIKLIMEEYEAHQRGIAGYAENTAAYTIEALQALEGEMTNLSGLLPLYQAIERVEKSVAADEKDRAKALGEVFDAQVESWDYSVRIAEAQAELTGNTRLYADALREVIPQVELWMQTTEDMPVEQMRELIELLLQYSIALQNVLDVQEELSFSTHAAFTLWQQALDPIVSAFGSIVDGAKAMGEAFGNAMKAMLKWAIQLAAQLMILVILMSIFKLASGGMQGFGGALSALLGGGIGPAPSDFIGPLQQRAFGIRGPQLAFAGGDITPRMQGGTGRGGDTHIHMENAVVLDGESFMRMVDSANYKLEKRKGGER